MKGAPVMHLQPAAAAALIAVAEQHMLQLTSSETLQGSGVDHERYSRCDSRCLLREAAGQQMMPHAVATPNCCSRLTMKGARSEQKGVVQARASAIHLGLHVLSD